MKTTQKQTNEKAAMWLLEVMFRTTAGLILWFRLDDMLSCIVAAYLLLTATLIIITNFVKAQQ